MNGTKLNFATLNASPLNTARLNSSAQGGATPHGHEDKFPWLWGDGDAVLWGDGTNVLTEQQ